MNTPLLDITSRKHILRFRIFLLSLLGLALFGPTTSVHAQQLGWEGETGVFVTPLAYTVAQLQKIGMDGGVPGLRFHPSVRPVEVRVVP